MKEIIKQTKALNVLYIEDEEILRNSSSELFENFFNSVTSAKNGQEGLELYNNGSYDLIITDISMPKLDGIELIKIIRESDKLIPIIVFSAWNNPSYMTTCISLNVDAYMLKPLNTNNMVEAFQKAAQKLQSSSNLITVDENSFKKEFDIDELTHLKSHNALLDNIHSCSSKEIPVMILINIDEFHIYNELYGLDIGDEILVKFAQNLQNFSSNYTYELYRMGGDEFVLYEKVVYIDPEKYEEDIDALFTFLEDSSIKIDGVDESVDLSVTIGVSFDADNSYGKADMALQEARRRGRKYLGFSADADRREVLQKNLYWRKELTKALLEKRVHAYYQSIVDRDEHILKYESLIRIKQYDESGNCNLISPHEFLDFSKISKQYIGLTEVMINQSFDTMIEKNVHVAINITFHDIENRDISKLLRKRISEHNLATRIKFDISSQVIFELLEHPGHEDYDKFVSFVQEFKALGVLLTIDNFGLGFSNMSKIADLLPNYVKIDSSLIKNIDSDHHAYTLVKAIVKFSKELGIKTIAEHVSSKSIFEKSMELGIDEFQGYYFGEPIEADEIQGYEDV